MTRRVQIVLSSGRPAGPRGMTPRLGFWQRFKLLIMGLAIATVAAALLIVAVVLGSMLAAVILVVIAVTIMVVIVRVGLKRARQ